jgi:hypothetical protein
MYDPYQQLWLFKKNRIITAVDSVTQDILLPVWDEFSYRLDIIRVAGGGKLKIYKLCCDYNQIYFSSCLIYSLTRLSPSFLIILYIFQHIVAHYICDLWSVSAVYLSNVGIRRKNSKRRCT